ncbi:MAG: NADPH-dependent glutamate synthase [candidate division KSB1 bacterium]|nr:NADPH-dependent glutamate synthase [candidate division KSB1 bacterium]
MKNKERLLIDPVKMPEQEPETRIHNQKEVPLGFSLDQAKREALRCLQCKNPKCVEDCPVNIDIPRFIGQIAEGDITAAVRTVKEKNVFPSICGRVCPQEEQCQSRCTVGKIHKDVDKSVGIGRLERFVADWDRAHYTENTVRVETKTGKKAAVVGSGPAGLTVAGDLAKKGHSVTVYEALHKPGGVLIYGIPEFRLPKAIVQQEVENLEKLGVQFRYNAIIGNTFTLQELRDEYDTVFIGTGAGLPRFLNVPGENLLGVYSANEYLTRANLMRAYDFPNSDTPILRDERVVIVGGGNVAMDAARTARRLGAEHSMIVYRRSLDELPARKEEVHHAKEEGIEFHLLRNPVEIFGDEQGWVTGIQVIKMQLGEPDESGRRRPIPIPDSEYKIDCGIVIVAIGNRPNPLLLKETPELQVRDKGTLQITPETGETSIPGVFSGGDIVQGAATVILAMGDGRKAAEAMHRYMTGEQE